MPFPISLHTDPRMAAYGFLRGTAPGGRHYFGADRFSAFLKECLARRLDTRVDMVPASPRATLRELTLFHDPDYLAEVRTRCMEGRGALDDDMTRAERGMDLAAASVVGTVLHAGKRIAAGQTRRAFVPIAGFPYAARNAAHLGAIYNDVAILIIYLKHALPRPRIAYVDLDAYFCGTVYEAFKADPFVAVADIHQDMSSFWSAQEAPEYGQEQAQTNWSEVLQPGVGDEAFLNVWPRMVSWIGNFRPDIIILNAGGMGLRGDGLGGLTYSSAVHKRAALDLMAKADTSAQGRIIVLGGGGHAPSHLANLWCDVLQTMVEGDQPQENAEEEDDVLRSLRLEDFGTPPMPSGDEAAEDQEPERLDDAEGDGEFEDDEAGWNEEIPDNDDDPDHSHDPEPPRMGF